MRTNTENRIIAKATRYALDYTIDEMNRAIEEYDDTAFLNALLQINLVDMTYRGIEITDLEHTKLLFNQVIEYKLHYLLGTKAILNIKC